MKVKVKYNPTCAISKHDHSPNPSLVVPFPVALLGLLIRPWDSPSMRACTGSRRSRGDASGNPMGGDMGILSAVGIIINYHIKYPYL